MSGLVFEKLTQSLAAGQVWRLTIAADFFRIAAAAWPVKVRILKAGRILGEMDGWQAGDFVRDVQFDAVEVVAGSIAQTVTVQIAGGGVGSDRVLGEVSVISGEVARTDAGIAFFASSSYGPSTGEYAFVQLWNPAASQRVVVLSKIVVCSNSAGYSSISIRENQAALGGVDAGGPNGNNKKIGGAASECEVRIGSSVSYPISNRIAWGLVSAAQATNTVEFNEPVIIPPGRGVIVVPSEFDRALSASFEFWMRSK